MGIIENSITGSIPRYQITDTYDSTFWSDQPTYTITYSNSSDSEDLIEIKKPKCFECKKEVESICVYVKNNSLIVIIHCHNDERRIDISLPRFKGSKDDAVEWFSDVFRYVFDEDSKWKKVKPDKGIPTIHHDRKVLFDWLENR